MSSKNSNNKVSRPRERKRLLKQLNEFSSNEKLVFDESFRAFALKEVKEDFGQWVKAWDVVDELDTCFVEAVEAGNGVAAIAALLKPIGVSPQVKKDYQDHVLELTTPVLRARLNLFSDDE